MPVQRRPTSRTQGKLESLDDADAVESLLSIQQQCHPQDHVAVRQVEVKEEADETVMDEDVAQTAEYVVQGAAMDESDREMEEEGMEEGDENGEDEDEDEEDGGLEIDELISDRDGESQGQEFDLHEPSQEPDRQMADNMTSQPPMHQQIGSLLSSTSSSSPLSPPSSSTAPNAMFSSNVNRDAQPPSTTRLAPIQPRPSAQAEAPSSSLVVKGYMIKDIPPPGPKKRTTPAKHQCPETHWRVKPYSCPECGRNFVRQDALTRHLRLDFGHNRCTGAPKDKDKEKEKEKDKDKDKDKEKDMEKDSEKARKPTVMRIAAKPNSTSNPRPPDFTGKEPLSSFKYSQNHPHSHDPATPILSAASQQHPADDRDPARSVMSTPSANGHSPTSPRDSGGNYTRPLGLAITLPTEARGEPHTPPNPRLLTPREQMVRNEEHAFQRRPSETAYDYHHDPRNHQSAHHHGRPTDSWHPMPSPSTPVTPGAPSSARTSPLSPLDQHPHSHSHPGHLVSRASSWSEPMPPRKSHISLQGHGSQEAGPWDRNGHPRSVSAPYPPPPPPHHHSGYPVYPYSPREAASPHGHDGRSQYMWPSSEPGRMNDPAYRSQHHHSVPREPMQHHPHYEGLQQQQHQSRMAVDVPPAQAPPRGGSKDWVRDEERVHPHAVPTEADRGHAASYSHHPDQTTQREQAAPGPSNHMGYRTPLVHRAYSYAEGGALSPSTHNQSNHWRPYPERRSEPDAAHHAPRQPVRSASLSSAPQYGPPPVMRRSPSPVRWNGSKGPMEPSRDGFSRGPSPSHSFSNGATSEENGRPRPAHPQRSRSSFTLPPLRDLEIRDHEQDARPYPPEYHRSMSYGSYNVRPSNTEGIN
ncbi:hypothetical protein BGZ73_002213 [Actinomortierella ambigua]|nr:hypothetical protein BGZ73_002213 [Actinomortierella ambigua]